MHLTGRNLEDRDKERAFEWIKSKNVDFLLPATSVTTDDSKYFFPQFQDEKIYKESEPFEWWQNASRKNLPDGMLTLIKEIFTLPPSTANIERDFSTLGQIFSDNRSNLDIERASKLCTVSNSLKIHDGRKSRTTKRKFDLVE